MTVQEAYKFGVKNLKTEFIDNPALDAGLIISFALKMNQKDIILNNRKITGQEFRNFNKLIKKRLQGNSVASIIKKKSFYDLEFFVNGHVLIPRPETELLIDIIKEKFNKDKPVSILDIGTGSGNIAIILAKYFINSKIDAVDVCKKALKIAEFNLKMHDLSEKIKLINMDIIKFYPEKKYDIIVSNPPYIETVNAKELIKKRLISDPLISLDGGKDGLIFYHRLCLIAEKFLFADSWLFMEHGAGQREKILKIFNSKNFNIQVFDDLGKVDRIIAVCKKEQI
jgi:release factor glutamine methyltransferase